VAHAWAECAAHGAGDEEIGTPFLPPLLLASPTAFTPEPVRRRVAGMKQILLMIAVVALVGQSVFALALI
jgi:hypothetical protein